MQYLLTTRYKSGSVVDLSYDDNEIEGSILQRIQANQEDKNVVSWTITPLEA